MGLGGWRRWFSRFYPAGQILQERYAAFRRLLRHDRAAHECLAELQEIGLGRRRVDWLLVVARYEALLAAVTGMVAELGVLAPGRHPQLPRLVRACDETVRRGFPPEERPAAPPYVLDLGHPAATEGALAGGKASHLAQLRQDVGLPVPPGFVVTTNAFHRYLSPDCRQAIANRLATLDLAEEEDLARTAAELTAMAATLPVPEELAAVVTAAAEALGEGRRFAVRSSARAEDGELSFAGQYRTLLDLPATELLAGYRHVVASRYSERALHYRLRNGLTDGMTPMAVLVLAMIDAAVSGVMTVGDPAEAATGCVVIHAVAGLGEQLVSGAATPQVIRICGGGVLTLPAAPCLLTTVEIRQLAAWGRDIAAYYGLPQDVEWCRDRQGRLCILQSRPLPSGPPRQETLSARPAADLPLLLRGGDRAVAGHGCGQVVRFLPGRPLATVPDGAVLVASTLPPDLVPLLPRLAAVAAEHGSSIGHFALVAREYGVPTLVNVPQVMATLADGQTVTVDADQAAIYAGMLDEVPLRRRLPSDTPVDRLVAEMLAGIAPLHLPPEPEHPDFVLASCRSFHDLVRFVHEQGMAAMFAVAARQGARARGSRQLLTPLPVRVYLVDIGGGLAAAGNFPEIGLDQVASRPMLAIWRGFSHPEIRWQEGGHFDWRSFSEAVMGGGVVQKDSRAYASYAVVDHDYVNFNIRFGYHYTVVEALAGGEPENNYAALRFVGGGAALAGRTLRLQFIAEVLRESGFRVTIRGDLLDASLGREPAESLLAKLEMVGRLLGATKLLDMVIADAAMARQFAREFLNGRSDFSSPTMQESQTPS
ncbi:MAG: PEP/pyruvate-binding domain-containing protein [Thermodesulfobacteriota bacterium]